VVTFNTFILLAAICRSTEI